MRGTNPFEGIEYLENLRARANLLRKMLDPQSSLHKKIAKTQISIVDDVWEPRIIRRTLPVGDLNPSTNFYCRIEIDERPVCIDRAEGIKRGYLYEFLEARKNKGNIGNVQIYLAPVNPGAEIYDNSGGTRWH